MFQGKYTTPTFKAFKTRYIALKNDTKKARPFFNLAFLKKSLFKLALLFQFILIPCFKFSNIIIIIKTIKIIKFI